MCVPTRTAGAIPHDAARYPSIACLANRLVTRRIAVKPEIEMQWPTLARVAPIAVGVVVVVQHRHHHHQPHANE
jgi:hypothetical protein